MKSQDWLLTAAGHCQSWDFPEPDELSDSPYRLYRFLTEVEDLLNQVSDDQERLYGICPLVRRLLNHSLWLQIPQLEPDPELGWSVLTLYDEPDFPLTVQLVAWSPGTISPIHNHACWGVVALISGEEENTFWQRSPTSQYPDQIERVGDLILMPGDLISFLPDAIHQVKALGDQPTISFNLYGATDYDQRFEFDAIAHTAKIF
ncbi:MAG: cupin [Leptolyngbyaceae bacterium]|nr:cupin [Leptolyngbyaceae bacterium]